MALVVNIYNVTNLQTFLCAFTFLDFIYLHTTQNNDNFVHVHTSYAS